MKKKLKESGIGVIIIFTIVAVVFFPKDIAKFIVLGVIMLCLTVKGSLFLINNKDFFKKLKTPENILNNEDSDTEEKEKLHFLIIQLSHRITEKLHQIYPDGSWDWVERPTREFFILGGNIKIVTHETGEFHKAEVLHSKFGDLQIEMIKPLTEQSVFKEVITEKSEVFDVKKWYDDCGAAEVLQIVDELNARGIKYAVIDEEGVISANGKKTSDQIKGFPKKTFWNELTQLLKADGLKVIADSGSIELSW